MCMLYIYFDVNVIKIKENYDVMKGVGNCQFIYVWQYRSNLDFFLSFRYKFLWED